MGVGTRTVIGWEKASNSLEYKTRGSGSVSWIGALEYTNQFLGTFIPSPISENNKLLFHKIYEQMI